MIISALRILPVACCLLCSFPLSAEIYKYQDAKGKWHYTDKEPRKTDESRVEKIEIEDSLNQDEASSKNEGNIPDNYIEGAARVAELRNAIEYKTGLRLYTNAKSGDHTNSQASIDTPMLWHYEKLIPALEAILKAAEPYSPAIFQLANLRNLKLGRNLKNKKIGKLAGWASRNDQSIYMNFEARPYSIGITFNHEVFHMIDIAFLDRGKITDQSWASLNKPGFKYGFKNFGFETSVGAMRRSDNGHPYSGFISRYGMTNEREDKAELFEALTNPVLRSRVMQLATTDKYLSAKILYLYKMIRRVDADFWNRLDQGISSQIASLR